VETINEIQDKIIEEFNNYEDCLDKYDRLIELGKEVPLIDEKYKTKEYQIKGCQSRVWLYPEFKDGKLYFTADSDAVITRGLIALLIKIFSGRTPEEILNANLYFLDKIGLKENLSPTRANGLLAMIKQIKLYALAYQSKLNQQKN